MDRLVITVLVQDLNQYGAPVTATYGQFCPVSKAAEVLCQRWTPLIVRELLVGSSRFSDLRRGLPGCSSALLSQRLKQLVRAGVVRRSGAGGTSAYELTEAGLELFPIVNALAVWGQRWVRSDYDDADLDPGFLLWDVRRYLAPLLAGRRATVLFEFRDQPVGRRRYWIVTDERETDVCLTEPGWEVTATVDADLRVLTQVWMGDMTFAAALRDGGLRIDGPTEVRRRIPAWFGQHPVLAAVGSARATATV
jgi:DNA-binding HxlR family transcriptional regulator